MIIKKFDEYITEGITKWCKALPIEDNPVLKMFYDVEFEDSFCYIFIKFFNNHIPIY
jgi:hypothetical protein